MIPKNLADNHFRRATAHIDSNGIPLERASVHYDLVMGNKKYPPKYVMSLATKFAIGKEHPASAFSAVEARDYFLRRGYTVIDRRKEAEKSVVTEDDESSFPEGRELFARHHHLERDGTMPKKAKAKRLAETGKLECEACGMNFHRSYGDLGYGFIEAHHTIPVSQLKGTTKTKINDLALVCSNCHRMLHRGKDLLTVIGLKQLIRNKSIP